MKTTIRDTALTTIDEAIDGAGENLLSSPLGSLCFDGETAETLQHGLFQAQRLCHGLAAKSGWWTDRKTGEPFTVEQVNIAEKLCLIHSEISEAMEGARKNLMDDKLTHRKMLEVELADADKRILDLGGFLNLDIAAATIEKLAFNQSRADHRLENRNAEGGKAF